MINTSKTKVDHSCTINSLVITSQLIHEQKVIYLSKRCHASLTELVYQNAGENQHLSLGQCRSFRETITRHHRCHLGEKDTLLESRVTHRHSKLSGSLIEGLHPISSRNSPTVSRFMTCCMERLNITKNVQQILPLLPLLVVQCHTRHLSITISPLTLYYCPPLTLRYCPPLTMHYCLPLTLRYCPPKTSWKNPGH